MSNANDIPIDIQIKKLSEWLTSRRISTPDWHPKILKIRENIKKALTELPDNDEAVSKILSDPFITYYHSQQILQVLKILDKDSKNFLGLYGSQRVKDWESIVSAYKEDSIYICEAAQILIQGVCYEIPALRRSFSKSSSLLEEFEKKENEMIQRIVDIEAESLKARINLGLESSLEKGVEEQIEILLSYLPVLYENITSKSAPLKKYVEFYSRMIQNNKRYENMKIEKEEMKIETNVLQTLNYWLNNGNVTVYEMIHGEAPQESIDERPKEFKTKKGEKEEKEEEDEIDWGDEEDNDGEEEEKVKSWEINVEESCSSVISLDESLTLLDNPFTRASIIDDLYELECFLIMRLAEISGVESYSMIEIEEEEIKESDILIVSSLISELTTGKIHHLQLLRSSPKYLDRILESLNLFQKRRERLQKSIEESIEKRLQQSVSDKETNCYLELLTKASKVLQEQLVADISARYNHRKVNIVGGVM